MTYGAGGAGGGGGGRQPPLGDDITRRRHARVGLEAHAAVDVADSDGGAARAEARARVRAVQALLHRDVGDVQGQRAVVSLGLHVGVDELLEPNLDVAVDVLDL